MMLHQLLTVTTTKQETPRQVTTWAPNQLWIIYAMHLWLVIDATSYYWPPSNNTPRQPTIYLLYSFNDMVFLGDSADWSVIFLSYCLLFLANWFRGSGPAHTFFVVWHTSNCYFVYPSHKGSMQILTQLLTRQSL